jgi:hypothetical protein
MPVNYSTAVRGVYGPRWSQWNTRTGGVLSLTRVQGVAVQQDSSQVERISAW